jgi:DNA repair protein RadC
MIEYKSFLAEVKPKYILTEKPRAKVSSSKDAFNIIKDHFDLDTINYQEQVVVLYLNRANNTVGIQKLSSGAISGCLIDGRIIFTMALQTGASGIIIAHNHPSGSLMPSQSDITITDKLKKFGKLINISLLDHLIINESDYLSLVDEGTI